MLKLGWLQLRAYFWCERQLKLRQSNTRQSLKWISAVGLHRLDQTCRPAASSKLRVQWTCVARSEREKESKVPTTLIGDRWCQCPANYSGSVMDQSVTSKLKAICMARNKQSISEHRVASHRQSLHPVGLHTLVLLVTHDALSEIALLCTSALVRPYVIADKICAL